MNNTNHKMLLMTTMPKTWILDLDGTLIKHNGYKTADGDSLLEGTTDFIKHILPEDMVIVVTSREKKYKRQTKAFLKRNNIRFNYIIFDAPYGERIIVNDKKPSGLKMAYAINVERDGVIDNSIVRNEDL